MTRTATPVRRPRPGSPAPGGQGRGSGRPARSGILALADPRRRGTILLVATGLVLTVFAGRLVELQAVRGESLASAALDQRLRTLELPAQRGTILDSGGDALAVTMEARNLTADQTLVTDPAAVAAELGPILGAESRGPGGAPDRGPALHLPCQGPDPGDVGPHRGAAAARRLQRAGIAPHLPGRRPRRERRRLRGQRGRRARRDRVRLPGAARRGSGDADLRARTRRSGDPDGRELADRGDDRHDGATDPRPRHPVRGAAGDREARGAVPGGQRHHRGDGPAHRRDPRAGDGTDLRSQQGRPPPRTRTAGTARSRTCSSRDRRASS